MGLCLQHPMLAAVLQDNGLQLLSMPAAPDYTARWERTLIVANSFDVAMEDNG